MASIRTSLSQSFVVSSICTIFLLGGCLPDSAEDEPGSGSGSGGRTGSGGAAPAGSGGSPGTGGSPGSGGAQAPVGTGGRTGSGGNMVAGTGGRGSSMGGSMGSGGRQGGGGAPGGSGGRSGMGGAGGGGAPSGTGGMMMGGGTGGASTAMLPAGYVLCVGCHGTNGEGAPATATMGGPEIKHPVADFATWVIRNGRAHPDFMEPMPKFPTDMLSDANLQGILSYLSAQPKPTTGPALYLDYCANCHGANGAGGVTMRSLLNVTMMSALTTSVRNGHHPGEFSNRREYMPKWTAAQLSDAELQLIFQHIQSL